MKDHIIKDEWNIIENKWSSIINPISESLFSIGNGKMGQRANFEEDYSGESLLGSYIAGVYYPDKTRVGWWKNGYPEYFAKVINSIKWIGLHIKINEQLLDLNKVKVLSFNRILNMKEGYLKRKFQVEMPNGNQIEVNATRIYSLVDDEAAIMQYEIKNLNFEGQVSIEAYLEGNVVNKDSHYDEVFWERNSESISLDNFHILSKSTKKSEFKITAICKNIFYKNEDLIKFETEKTINSLFLSEKINVDLKPNETVKIEKKIMILSSENYPKDKMEEEAIFKFKVYQQKSFDQIKNEQSEAWLEKWKLNDIEITNDLAAQQAIRFNIFQLHQTYTGKDHRLNIGPKGFTGEKYGGSTYWDTEAYCIPFYLGTADQEVSRNLLKYRYLHLEKAIKNAVKLGFDNGAALYPMVTMNGEECHNEWEITFEEIHRNGAIAYAIFNYERYTGDKTYIPEFGLEVLIGIARFWKQRFSWSIARKLYVMLGVSGPNEYENNINNNWYTSYIAKWCLDYTAVCIENIKKNHQSDWNRIAAKTNFNLDEIKDWQKISSSIFFPTDDELGIFLQQENYLDKEQILVKDLDTKHLPLNQKWSWDRILRSCFIKQADVLQGIYFFEDDFDLETIKRNYDFYEARTVHESSLSPCIHSILAAKLSNKEKAYDFYLRTSRLDLDNYNNDTEDGLHITSMAGTWLAIVEGFGGYRVRNNQIHLQPILPDKWKSFTFHINFRGNLLHINIQKNIVKITNKSNQNIEIICYNKKYFINNNSETSILI